MKDAAALMNDIADFSNGEIGIFTNAGGVGDGVTDNLAAWDAFIAAHDHVYIPHGNYYFSGPMNIPKDKKVEGAGYKTIITGAEGQFCTINIGTGTIGLAHHSIVRDLMIEGSADRGLYVDHAHTHIVENIHVHGTHKVGFDFNTVFGSTLSNLTTAGAAISDYGFHCRDEFNANDCCNWYTSNICESNIFFDSAVAHGNTFNMLTCQGGDIGLYYRRGYANNFNGIYCENTVIPVQLGDYNNRYLVNGGSITGLDLGGAYLTHKNQMNATACLELSNVHGVAINGVKFTGADNAGNRATVTLLGDGTGAKGFARVNTDGTIHSVWIARGGSGYSNATVEFAGTAGGAGAAGTVQLNGDAIERVTITDAGSGYAHAQCPVAIRYTNCSRISINGEYINDGQGLNSCLYPWIVRDANAIHSSDIYIPETLTQFVSGTGRASSFRKINGANTYALTYYDSQGNPVNHLYVPPEFP